MSQFISVREITACGLRPVLGSTQPRSRWATEELFWGKSAELKADHIHVTNA